MWGDGANSLNLGAFFDARLGAWAMVNGSHLVQEAKKESIYMTCVLMCAVMYMETKMIRPQMPEKLYKEIIDNVPGAEFADKAQKLYDKFKELDASPHEALSGGAQRFFKNNKKAGEKKHERK